MSPSKFLQHDHAVGRSDLKEHPGNGGLYPPHPLKISKDSHTIRKPPSSSLSSAMATVKPRHPVIIYTHSPKVIHTNPKDFMALVQKLTGMSRSDEDHAVASAADAVDRRGKSMSRVAHDHGDDNKNISHGHNSYSSRSYSVNGTGSVTGGRRSIFANYSVFNEDSESSSVITTEENTGEHGQVNSSCSFTGMPVPAPYPPPSPSPFDGSSGINYGAYLSTIPIFPTSSAEGFLCGNQSLSNIEMDPLFFSPAMRSSFSSSSSSSGFDGFTEFREF